MNKLFLQPLVVTVISVATILSLESCVNEEYDISNGIDMDMQLLQNASLPLGDISGVSVKTLFGDNGSGSSNLKEDENGNLSMTFGKDVISKTFKMPEVKVDGDGGFKEKTRQVDFKIKSSHLGIPGNQLADNLISSLGTEHIYYSKNETK